MAAGEQGFEDEATFKWGKKRGVGGVDRSGQFYESFTYDGIEYFLYDIIYLYKEDQDPYIGKLVKIWLDSHQRKRIKVVWFFQPTDVISRLEDSNVPKKEIFLACGEGPSVTSINPLEVIIGRCKVVCTSKDKRNAQPLDEDVELADYFFYRTFNVDNFTISENIDSKIAGVEVDNFFNKGVSRTAPITDGSKPGEGSNKSPLNDTASEMLTKSGLPGIEAVGLRAHSSSGEPAKVPPPKAKENYSPHHVAVVDKNRKRAAVNPAFSAENKVHSGAPSDALEQKSSKKMKLLDNSTLMKEQDLQSNAKPIEAPRKPFVDRRKWFKDLNWEDKLKGAEETGKLLLLENLDPSYTSHEVEDIVGFYTKENCRVKMVEHTVHSSPLSGQAFVVLSSKEAALEVLRKLNKKCLMLPNSRPLVCRRVTPRSQVQHAKFLGHFSVDNMRRRPAAEEFSNGVSTSHCSQPNTLEYEMAMEWRLLQENFQLSSSELFKQQRSELSTLWSYLKTKY